MEGSNRELEFVETLGSGGFGAVYLANLHGRDRFVRRVAVKVMREGLDGTPELVARQKDEARLLGLLAHDAIVQVLDLAEVEGRPAVVMEYVEGVDVAEILRRVGPGRLSRRAAAEIVAAVAGALDAAWTAPSPVSGNPLRVIHRDIKPANVLVTTWGRVKVLDFGVAKADFARDGHSTNAGWGTPRFMAPEQWLGEPVGPAIDIYALGVTLYELVADRPWDRPPLARTPYEHHIGAQLEAQAAVPAALLDLVAAMTAFEAGDRPTAAEVHDRLAAVVPELEGEPLVSLARRELPGMLQARRRELARSPLPGVASVAGISPVVSGRPPTPAPAAPEEPSLRQASGPSFADVARLGAVAAVFVVGSIAVLAVALVVRYWPAVRGVSPEASPTVVSEAAPAPPVEVETAAAEAPASAPMTPPAAEPAVVKAGPKVRETKAADATNPRIGPAAASPSGSAATSPSSAEAAPTLAPAAIASPAAAPVTTTATPPAASPPPSSAATVPFDVVSVPMGATVTVDGAVVGKTPIADLALSPGSHRFVLTLGDQTSPPQTANVSTGGPTGLRYTFSSSTWNTLR